MPFSYETRQEAEAALGLAAPVPDWAENYERVTPLRQRNDRFIVQETKQVGSPFRDEEGKYTSPQPRYGLADAQGNWIIPLGHYQLRAASWGLIQMIEEETFCLYDWNGNRRTPDFSAMGKDTPSIYLVSLNGRQGILPQILSDAEIEQYKNGG